MFHKIHLCRIQIGQLVGHYLVVFCNKYAIRVPFGNSCGCLEGRLLVKSGHTDAAKGGEGLLGTLHEIVDATDKRN